MARLTILMATYNGERFLQDQLNSFSRQSFYDWDLWVSDDGSCDNTKTILHNYDQEQNGHHKVCVIDGPHRGFVQNFLNLTCCCQNDSEFFAFSDQDDIWQNDKLQRAINWLETIPTDIPALYCSRTEIVDEDARPTSPPTFSPLMKIIPSFSNALVQSIAGGNTMVFNKAAKQLIESFGGVIDVPSHDWWVYLLVTGVGGKVYYDPISSLLYRQHRKNVVGSNRSLGALWIRLKKFMDGQYKNYNEKNVYYLTKCAPLLTKENQDRLAFFSQARKSSTLQSIKALRKAGVRRNGFLFNTALWIGLVIGRI